MPPSRTGADVTTSAITLAQKSAPSRAAKPARGSSISSAASTASSRLTAVRRTRSTVGMRVDYAPESRSLDRAHESIRSRVGHRRETRRAAPKLPFARYFVGAYRALTVVDLVARWSPAVSRSRLSAGDDHAKRHPVSYLVRRSILDVGSPRSG